MNIRWYALRILILTLSFTASFANASLKKDIEIFKREFVIPEIERPILNKSNSYRIKLGKILFFDPRLSGSNWISCSTCHNPTLGWADGLPTAIGEGQKVLGRATPTILNTAYGFLQMWDGRFRSLEHQALGPIEAAGEMNQDLDELVLELRAIPGYKTLFSDAYPGRNITKATIAQALASFERTIVSTDTAFDRWMNGNERAINDAAKQGFKLFVGKGNCAKCHSGYNFTDDGFHNIGLDDDDVGRFSVNGLPVEKGAFKTPTLRNIAITGPYMHNGAYTTLEQVIDHYVKGGVNKTNLSPNFEKARLSKYQVRELIAFLRTLTSDPMELIYPEMPN